MSKCGVIDIDVRSNKPKVKLYKDEEGNLKGDGLCTYVKVESVQLAQTIIDGASIKAGTVIKVQKAKFEMKGNYNPKLKPKKLSKKELERRNKKHEKMLAWEPDKLRGERSKRDKVVVIENVFDPQDFDTDASLILECSTKLRLVQNDPKWHHLSIVLAFKMFCLAALATYYHFSTVGGKFYNILLAKKCTKFSFIF